jgi:hypothetical protein
MKVSVLHDQNGRIIALSKIVDLRPSEVSLLGSRCFQGRGSTSLKLIYAESTRANHYLNSITDIVLRLAHHNLLKNSTRKLTGRRMAQSGLIPLVFVLPTTSPCSIGVEHARPAALLA